MTGRCIELKEVGKVAWGQVVDNFETEEREFVLNTPFDREPMKRLE